MSKELTVKEYLEKYLGLVEGAKDVAGLKLLGDSPAGTPVLGSSVNGSLYVTCGGDVVLFFGVQKNIRSRVVLRINASKGKAWDIQRRKGKGFNEIGSRPFDFLELAMTG